MKIYTRVVMDLETLEVVEEEAFEYDGPVSEAKGGGGGSAGKIGYPSYVETAHNAWLSDSGTDSIDYSIVDLMNVAFANDPYTTMSPFDPDTVLSAMLTGVTNFETQVDMLSDGTTLSTLMSNVLSDSSIEDAIDAYEAELVAEEDTTTVPRFEAGMRDINAVYSSAFVVGKALIEEGRARNVASYSAKLRLQRDTDTALKVIDLKLRYQQALATVMVEANRIKIVAKKEERDQDNNYDIASAQWDMDVLLKGGTLLGMPGGGSYVPDNTGPSKVQSAIGGALSGAAAGAMVGSTTGWGAPIGAAAGAAIGMASALL